MINTDNNLEPYHNFIHSTIHYIMLTLLQYLKKVHVNTLEISVCVHCAGTSVLHVAYTYKVVSRRPYRNDNDNDNDNDNT